MEKYLSVEQASKALNCTSKHIYNLRSQGKLKGMKEGSKLFFALEEIRNYQEATSHTSSLSSSSSHLHVNTPEPIKTVEDETGDKTKNEEKNERITVFPDEQSEQKPFFPEGKENEFLISVSSYKEGTWKWIDEHESSEPLSGAQIKALYGVGKYRLTVSRKTREGWKFFGRHNVEIGLRPDEIKQESEITILRERNKESEERIEKLEAEWVNLKSYQLTSKDNFESFKTDQLENAIETRDTIILILEALEKQAKMSTETLLPMILTALKESTRKS